MQSESIGWVGGCGSYPDRTNGIFSTTQNYDEYNETAGSDALEPTNVCALFPSTTFIYIPTRPGKRSSPQQPVYTS